MTTIDTELFAQFADTLNNELAAAGARLRISREAPTTPGTMRLLGDAGFPLGAVPDHVDAQSLLAFEHILARYAAGSS